MSDQTQQEQPSASDEAWSVLDDAARAAINEETDGGGWARRWWQAEAKLIELRRQKDDVT